jgi:hypothetical protein
MNANDPLIAQIADEDPARRMPPSGAESELAHRVRQRVLKAAAMGSDIPPRHLGSSHGSRKRHRRTLRPSGTIAVFVASTSVVLAVLGVFAVLGHSGHTSTHSPASPGVQAQQLYAPVSHFLRSTTAADRAELNASAKADTHRVNACQAPYSKQLFQGLVGGPKYQLYNLYERGTLMESYQSRDAPVAAPLSVLAQSLDRLTLSNPIMQSFAQALATEFHATLDAPTFSSCAFLKGLAAHHFSLAWAKRSSYGRTATRFWNQINAAGNRASRFWAWVEVAGKAGPGAKFFTKAQLQHLANLPGELG